MYIHAPEGTIVTPHFENGQLQGGYESEKHRAMKYLESGKTYTVLYTEANSWNTDVYLKEFPGIPFNIVHFK